MPVYRQRYLQEARGGRALKSRQHLRRPGGAACLLTNKQTPRNVAMPPIGQHRLYRRNEVPYLRQLELSFEAHANTT